jgi:hypothetical protein
MLTRFALEEASAFDWHELAVSDPTAATPLAIVARFFRRHERPLPFELDHFIMMRQVGYLKGMDRFPYRELDLEYCLRKLQISRSKSSLSEYLSDTAFGRHQHYTRYTTSDVYSLTHCIFYLTDVGGEDLRGAVGDDVACRLRQALVILSSLIARERNADQLGELLLCWYFSGVPSSHLSSVIFRSSVDRFLEHATGSGSIAPTMRSLERARQDDGSDFSMLYHTTLVAAMLFSFVSSRII